MKLTAHQRIQKAGVKILAHPDWQALAGVMFIGKTHVVPADSKKINTACTNGKDVWYNEGFVSELNDKELRFLRLHEEHHKAYNHLITWRHLWKINPRVANISADQVINIAISDTDPHEKFLAMPKCGYRDYKFRGWSTIEVFRHYMANPDELPPPQGGGGDGDGDGDGGFDSHDWEGAEAMSPEEQQELSREIETALRQGIIASGLTGSGGNRALEELTTPQVDWRETLSEFIQSSTAGRDISTYRKPNRRWMYTGHYMASSISETVGELVIGADMSGSISRELPVMFTEIKEILDTARPEKVRLLYWDTKVCADEEYDPSNYDGFLTTTRPEGGGGTKPACVAEYISERRIAPAAVIMLTDGWFSDRPFNVSCPVLWVVINNRRFTAKTGKTLHVNI